MALDVGQICMKVVGREAGMLCVVLKNVKDEKSKKAGSFVMVTGPKLLTGIKRRKANINHLESTKYKLEIKEEATDEEVYKAWEESALIKKLKLKKPSAGKLKSEKPNAQAK